jgi:hypothetical protein
MARWEVRPRLLCGLALATFDPGLRDLKGHLSQWDPRYIVFITQNVLSAVLVTQLFATELHMTGACARPADRPAAALPSYACHT